jgi:hypothetical protein
MSETSYSFKIGEDAEVAALVGQIQRMVIEHPVAAQAIFSALVAEGRAFAKTEAGAVWHRRLASSNLVAKGRAIWEVATLNVLEEDESVVVPSRILDAFVKLTHERNLDVILSRLYEERGSEEGHVATP